MHLVVGVPEHMRTVSGTLVVYHLRMGLHMCMYTHPEDVACGIVPLTSLHDGASNHYNVVQGPSIWDETS